MWKFGKRSVKIGGWFRYDRDFADEKETRNNWTISNHFDNFMILRIIGAIQKSRPQTAFDDVCIICHRFGSILNLSV